MFVVTWILPIPEVLSNTLVRTRTVRAPLTSISPWGALAEALLFGADCEYQLQNDVRAFSDRGGSIIVPGVSTAQHPLAGTDVAAAACPIHVPVVNEKQYVNVIAASIFPTPASHERGGDAR